MLLLVGLGNPGAEHAFNRHNIGFMAVDALAACYRFSPWRARFSGKIAEGTIAGARILLQKPSTYMNLSGQAVGEAVRFYKLATDAVIVFHDELELAPGRLKVKRGGGTAGHNGLKSLDAHIGPDYWRVRLGIGHPGAKPLVHDYVLHDFAAADRDWLTDFLTAMAEAAPALGTSDDALTNANASRFMTKIALLTKPPAATTKPDPADTES